MLKVGRSSCEEFVHAITYVKGEKLFMPRIRSFFILSSRRETVYLGNLLCFLNVEYRSCQVLALFESMDGIHSC
jgi:hypothetical protein